MVDSQLRQAHSSLEDGARARRAAMESCAKVFFLARGARPLPEYAAAVIRAKMKMFKLVRKNRGGPLFVRMVIILFTNPAQPLPCTPVLAFIVPQTQNYSPTMSWCCPACGEEIREATGEDGLRVGAV